ncbi:MAG TPA: DUF6625 family protein [Methylocystis sp.]|nr:DUF6625 family protein [Methylocystis sp.]
MTEPRILVFSLWFGPWPQWMRCFLASCRFNPTIDWLVISDAPALEDAPPNVLMKPMSFADFRDHLGKTLDIAPKWTDAYKVSDVRPALAALFPAEVAGYDYWGYCDLDLVFGDIRRFYTPQFLDADAISTHAHVFCGHFALLRNTERMANAFRKFPFWRHFLSTNVHKSFDEQKFSYLFLPFPKGRRLRRLFTPFLGGGRFVEQFSTNLPPLPWIDGKRATWPERWLFDRGRLTAEGAGEREFLYLHFTNWNSNRWTGDAVAPWSGRDDLVALPQGQPDRFVISREGFTPAPDEALAAA